MNNLNLTITMPEDATREEAVALADEVMRRAMTVENVETVGVTMGSTMMSGQSLRRRELRCHRLYHDARGHLRQ